MRKKFKIVTAMLCSLCMALCVPNIVNVSATTVNDVIAYARSLGMPESEIQNYISQYGDGEYTSEQCDKAIAYLRDNYKPPAVTDSPVTENTAATETEKIQTFETENKQNTDTENEQTLKTENEPISDTENSQIIVTEDGQVSETNNEQTKQTLKTENEQISETSSDIKDNNGTDIEKKDKSNKSTVITGICMILLSSAGIILIFLKDVKQKGDNLK